MVSERDRPPQPRRRSNGKWIALALAVLVNLAFVGVLVFSVTWRNPPAPAVTAELYAPPVRAPSPPKPEPPKPEPPKPDVPKPEPPKPEPLKPPPKAEKPDAHEADIALKARQAEERKQREQAEKLRAESDKRKREAEEKLKADARREAEVRERQQRETQVLREQAALEAKARTEAEARLRADAEAKLRADSEAKARAAAATQAKMSAESAARARAEGDWIRRIQSKIRGNVILPDITGNPEAIFDVVQLPTGEILEVVLRKSSGVRAYDEAVQRAILKSSPLPIPERAELFQRTLALKFRPVD